MTFVDHNYEHTFPILIDKTTQEIIVIDALNHVTKIVKNPAREQMSYKNIESIKIKIKFTIYVDTIEIQKTQI